MIKGKIHAPVISDKRIVKFISSLGGEYYIHTSGPVPYVFEVHFKSMYFYFSDTSMSFEEFFMELITSCYEDGFRDGFNRLSCEISTLDDKQEEFMKEEIQTFIK